MKDFFGNLNFPRTVILVSFLASAVLGWFWYQRSSRLDQVHLETSRVTGLVKQVQENAIRLNDLQGIATNDKLADEEDPEFYIRGVASQDLVDIGQVNTSVTTRVPMRGVEDNIYRIRPANRSQRYSRGQIGNFLYKLEADSRRVKVTSLKLQTLKRLKPGEVGDDAWTFEAEITTRVKVDE